MIIKDTPSASFWTKYRDVIGKIFISESKSTHYAGCIRLQPVI